MVQTRSRSRAMAASGRSMSRFSRKAAAIAKRIGEKVVEVATAAAAGYAVKSAGGAIGDAIVKATPKSVKRKLDFFGESPAAVTKSTKRGLKRRRGAAISRSAGRFRRGTRRLQTLDKFSMKGVVLAMEKGGVLEDAAEPWAQSITLGHTNFSQFNMKAIVAMALTKLCSQKLGINLENFYEGIKPEANSGRFFFKLTKKQNTVDNAVSTSTMVDYTNNWIDLARWFYGHLGDSTATTEWLSLACDEDFVQAANAVSFSRRFNIDLSKCRIHLYSKSALKIQNRTINASGSDEADDVDNVPLYGKSYEGRGSFAYYKTGMQTVQVLYPNIVDSDYLMNAAATNVTGKYGIINVKNAVGSTLAEPPGKAQFAHVQSVGKAHLDPGQIKTSVLINNFTVSLNSLIKNLMDPSSVKSLLSKYGKFRFFILEKMIQAVGTDSTKCIRIAYEVDLKLGAQAVAPRIQTTNYVVDQIPI